LCVEAKKSLILNKDKLLDVAKIAGISIVGYSG